VKIIILWFILVCSLVLISISAFLLRYSPKRAVINRFQPTHLYFPNIKKMLDEANVRYLSNYYTYLVVHATVLGIASFLFLKDISFLEFGKISGHLLPLLLFILVYNGIIILQISSYRKDIQDDLLKVHEILYWQSQINVSDERSIAYASQSIKGPLKQHFIELAGAYRLRRNVLLKLEEIRNFSPVEELHAFTYMLEDKYRTGMTEEFHKSSMDMLKRLRKVKLKSMKIRNLQLRIIYALILFALFTAIVGGPIILNAWNQFQNVIQ